jgi:hypothetical protein
LLIVNTIGIDLRCKYTTAKCNLQIFPQLFFKSDEIYEEGERCVFAGEGAMRFAGEGAM